MKWIAVGIYDRHRAEDVSEEDALREANKIFPREKSVVHKGRIFIHSLVPKFIEAHSPRVNLVAKIFKKLRLTLLKV
jgi:hypothetical protein